MDWRTRHPGSFPYFRDPGSRFGAQRPGDLGSGSDGPREAGEPPHCAPDDPPARLSQPTSASPISSPPRPCSPLLSIHCALATPPPSWGRFQAQSAEPKRCGTPARRWPDCLQAPGSSLLGSPSFCPSPRQGMHSPQGSGVSPPSKGGRGRKAGFGFVFCVFFSFHVPQWPRHDGDVPPSSPGGEWHLRSLFHATDSTESYLRMILWI